MITVAFDPTPRPARSYMKMWGLDPECDKDRKKVNAWCLTQKIPGAFRGPDGSWWLKPMALIEWGEAERPQLKVAR